MNLTVARLGKMAAEPHRLLACIGKAKLFRTPNGKAERLVSQF